LEPFLTDGWTFGPPPDGLFIEGSPSILWREQPSDNGGGWWAGDKLVYQYCYQPLVADVIKSARRRLEDDLRKSPRLIIEVLRWEAENI